MLDDAGARRRALDTSRSFAVHAPAGSGKTELLIQRYLALLARVEYPEQVLAITFTRKAASEMRHRVLRALELARTRPEGVSAHQGTTLQLAGELLEADGARGWNLAQQPTRLRIQTIDAFNAWLVRERLFQPEGGGHRDVVIDARRYYRSAARRVLRRAEDREPIARRVRRVLRAWGNDFAALEAALAELLPRREQWLRHLAPLGGADLRAELEASWAALAVAAQASALRCISQGEAAALERLCRHAAENARRPETRSRLASWTAPEARLGPESADTPAWLGLAHLLLTESGSWRKRFGASFGLGPDAPEFKALVSELGATLSKRDLLLASLQKLASLPALTYDTAQWRLLEALRAVLLQLAAELAVVFAEEGVADFVEIGLAAQRVLGGCESPSELLLALDRRIEHILVDEYQDTSHMQFGLLSLLTAGWQPGDGRTLFLVGDVMQSIYRFRDADVKLFLQAEKLLLGQSRMERLQLTRNFRSAPVVVSWVNHQFQAAIAANSALGADVIAFHACAPERHPQADQFVRIHALRDARSDAEIEIVCDIVATEANRSPQQTIAVLVQSRRHLEDLGARLQAAGHEFATVEVQRLDQTQVGQDLANLARALLHLGDTLAWLSALRAPWCGLLWADLLVIGRAAERRTVWDALHDDATLRALSSDGRKRVEHFRSCWGIAMERRAAVALSMWVRDTWSRLGGPACLASSRERLLADKFFGLLDSFSVRDDLDDPTRLGELLAQAPVDPEPSSARIQIMTLHRAKGLEFDTVVLFGLAREPRAEPVSALLWQERIEGAGRRRLLLAPPALGGADDTRMRYLRTADATEAAAERLRLLYVGATRAKERLHLVANLSSAPVPAPRSLLALLWPSLAGEFGEPTGEPDVTASPLLAAPPLKRLATLPISTEPPRSTRERPPYRWAGAMAAQIGTVVHRELHLLAQQAVADPSAHLGRRSSRYRRHLALLGVDRSELDSASARVEAALRRCLDDPHGRWLLAPHRDGHSEFVVQMNGPGAPRQFRIDRTFIDADGTRWIVDYKVGLHEGSDLAAYLESELNRYRPQLHRYGEAMRLLEDRPLKLGLYFPLHAKFLCWDYES